MTDQMKGFWFIFGGVILLVLSLDVIIKGLLLLVGLWMVDRGMKLRQDYRLSERIRLFIFTYMR